MKMKAHDSKPVGMYSNKIVPQEIRKITNKQPNFTPKGTRKRRKNKAQRQQKEGIKVSTEINNTENRKKIEKNQ